MQLYALLQSYVRHVAEPRPDLTVIYRATTSEHEDAYREALANFTENRDFKLKTVKEEENGFRENLLNVLRYLSVARVFFLVDDIVFIRPLDFELFKHFDLRSFIPSLRLGQHISYSYTSNCSYTAPALVQATPSLFTWRWVSGKSAWGYPMSVDGNLFDRHEMLAMASSIKFDGPNSFESRLAAKFGPLLKLRLGVCFYKARLVNIPWNRVQDEIDNRSENLTEDELLRRWQAGECIDIAKMDNLAASSVHVEIKPLFKNRQFGI